MSEYSRRYLAVIEFSRLMKDKLEVNAHKGDWINCNPWWLLDRLKEETAELEEALHALARGEGTTRDVMLECADIANFSMFVSDVVSQRSKV